MIRLWVSFLNCVKTANTPFEERRLMEESYQQEMNSRALSSMSQSVDLYATLDGSSSLKSWKNKLPVGEIGPESDEEYQGPGRKRNRKGRLSKVDFQSLLII